MSSPRLQLTLFHYDELQKPQTLYRLDQQFLQEIQQVNENLYNDLLAYRYANRPFTALVISQLLLACAPILEQFIARLFRIEEAVALLQLQTLSNDPIFIFKKWFVLREAKRRLSKPGLPSFAELLPWVMKELEANQLDTADIELAVARLAKIYLDNLENHAEQIDRLINWCVAALRDPTGQAFVQNWVSFHLPAKLDYNNLVSLEPLADDPMGRMQAPTQKLRQRDGFSLTDPRMSQREALDEVHYCVYCHTHEGDFCSKGFPEKKNDPQSPLKKNPLDEVLTGCPLEEKISEMHELKKAGYSIAALAMVMVDNPMCPATGHRICNDCMKACIYQKQQPVDIPQTETRILTDVLNLPWGVEIYDLLTRWNPLRQSQWVAKPYNGLKVLVMGMGPAGFTLAHHLLMEGFAVVGFDGLKIEPLPKRYLHEPIYRYQDLCENLADRVMAGFGGVAEYGITVRWDKNFLKLIYLTLARRPHFQVVGNVRFGGTLTVEDAWQLGFDHMAIAVGAGLPKELAIPGSLAPGMRQANDFLMALQLTGAAKATSLANLQMRLPCVVIGGGLTGIDTATEAQAYYISQVEKVLMRYETLAETLGEARIREQFDCYELAILNEWLAHGRAVRAERQRAEMLNQPPDFIDLLRQWGGVTVIYRRLLRESPAYRRNHEEVAKAFEEGIYYAEGLDPVAVHLDSQGHVESLVCVARVYDEAGNWVVTDEQVTVPARSIFVATGARPNIAYEFEHRGTFQRDGLEYRTFCLKDNQLDYVPPDGHCKTKQFGAFTSYAHENKHVTFLGDTHPVFHGSVVKAIASAKRTYPEIINALGAKAQALGDTREYQRFAEKITNLFSAKLLAITRLSPSVVALKIAAPMAAKNFRPGQFYRLQNFESQAQTIAQTRLQTEAIALLGTAVDQQQGTIELVVLEKGVSSRLIATFQPGQAMAFMGPTGVRTKIPQDRETILIVGGRTAIAYLRAVGPALRQHGNRVLFMAYLSTKEELFWQEEIEAAADAVVWITRTGEPILARRLQDIGVTADVFSAIARYARNELSRNPDGPPIQLHEVDRVILTGSQSFIQAFQLAREHLLKDVFNKHPPVFASIYGPMQCMLKGVCAQCLQWQIDPQTGKRTKAVFACSWQEQPLEMVDLHNLQDRLTQNRVQEILTNLWLDHLLASQSLPNV